MVKCQYYDGHSSSDCLRPAKAALMFWNRVVCGLHNLAIFNFGEPKWWRKEK